MFKPPFCIGCCCICIGYCELFILLLFKILLIPCVFALSKASFIPPDCNPNSFEFISSITWSSSRSLISNSGLTPPYLDKSILLFSSIEPPMLWSTFIFGWCDLFWFWIFWFWNCCDCCCITKPGFRFALWNPSLIGILLLLLNSLSFNSSSLFSSILPPPYISSLSSLSIPSCPSKSCSSPPPSCSSKSCSSCLRAGFSKYCSSLSNSTVFSKSLSCVIIASSSSWLNSNI